MRAVILEVDERMLAERSRLGLDRFDEMWEGVLHMVPAPTNRHQRMEAWLVRQLFEPTARRGCDIAPEVSVYGADDDYRTSDVAVFAAEAGSRRGIDGAPLVVVEIRSPCDESLAKVPWYLGRGAGSVVIIDQDTLSVEVFPAEGAVSPDGDGLFVIAGLDARLGPRADGGALVIETEDGTHEFRG